MLLEIKNITIADIMFILAMLAITLLSYKGITFNPQDYGLGVAAIFGGKGAHIWAKSQEGS